MSEKNEDSEEETVIDLKQNSEIDKEDDTETAEPEKKAPSPEEEIAKAKQDYLYLYADFENFRKKSLQERSQFIKYANENILRDLVQIMDNFKLAISMDVNSDNLKSYVEGVNMIARELDNLMDRFGVSKVSTENEFDPNLHEAVSTEASEDKEDGEIIKVYKDGYKLHDRLLRPAQVVIADNADKD